MTAIQKRLLELLDEIDAFCKASDIEYSLTERTAKMAIEAGAFTCKEYIAEIMLYSAGYSKFVDAVKASGRTDREIETLENNVKMDGVYARYVDNTTTLWDLGLGKSFNKLGIAVNIRILRPGKQEPKNLKMLEQVVRNNSRDSMWCEFKYGNSFDMKRRSLKLGFARLMYRRKDKMRDYFQACINSKKKANECFYHIDKDTRVFEADVLKNTREVMLENHRYRIADSKSFLKLFGEKGSEYSDAILKLQYDSARPDVIVDFEVPYPEKVSNLKWGSIERNHVKNLNAYYNRCYIPYKKLADEDWRIVRRTTERFRLYQLYRDKTDEIVSKYESGRLDEVREDLKELLEKMEYFEKRNHAIRFDTKLFEIACDILRQDGKGAMVDHIIKRMPKEFEEDVEVFLEKQGVH